jgi:hypothetical protein
MKKNIVKKRVKKNELLDDVGFLLEELAANDTKKVTWKKLPGKTKKIFQEVVNSGIDKEQAEIRHRDNKMFIFSYADADNDFSAMYIVFNDRAIFSFEN